MYSGVPEPPTLNALNAMAEKCSEVVFLRSNMYFKGWDYASNINVIEISKCIAVKDVVHLPFIAKMLRFIAYCFALRKQITGEKYEMIVIHDYLGLLAYWFVTKITGFKGLVWFNSYDPLEPERYNLKPYTLIGIVKNNFSTILSSIDYLSIPSKERLPYYPIENLRKKFFILPNFPSVKFYTSFFEPKHLSNHNPIRILYQGAIGEGHGIEELIVLLKNKIQDRELHLVLKGWLYDEYKEKLYTLAEKEGVGHLLFFEGYSWYKDLPNFTKTCDIGWAVHSDENNIAFKTAATASNKIYEYAALGMPVFLYDSESYRANLGKYAWAFFTNLTTSNLLTQIDSIITRYDELSLLAHKDFMSTFNYEKVFNPIIEEIFQDHAKRIHP